MRCPQQIGPCLEISLQGYDFDGGQQILILFDDQIGNTFRDVQKGRKLYCSKKVLLLGVRVLIQSVEVLCTSEPVLQFEAVAIDLPDNLT